MKTEKLEHWIGGIVLIAGAIFVATVIIGSAAHADLGQMAARIPAGSVPMIDPFALKVIWVQTPPSPEGKGPLESVDVDLGRTIRIPDRQVVRSVFKPSP
jgi:hypothetical protein